MRPIQETRSGSGPASERATIRGESALVPFHLSDARPPSGERLHHRVGLCGGLFMRTLGFISSGQTIAPSGVVANSKLRT